MFFQNSNNSVRVTDEFMQAVVDDGAWTTRAVRDGRPMDTYKARELFREISEAAHLCGDPGLQFDTTINDWHTCSNTDRDQRVQPVLRVHVPRRLGLQPGVAEPDALPHHRRRVRRRAPSSTRWTWCCWRMEIIVGFSKYPTERISKNSHAFRPLGLGYANLGALLMATGLPYDSDAGRNYAAAITSLMCGEAYAHERAHGREDGALRGLREERGADARRHPQAPQGGLPTSRPRV